MTHQCMKHCYQRKSKIKFSENKVKRRKKLVNIFTQVFVK